MSTGNYERDVRGLGGQARYHAGPYGQRFFDPQEYFPGPGGSRSHGLGDPPGVVCVADTEVLPWGTFVDATYTTRSRIPPYRTRPVTIYDQPVESIMALSLPRGGGLFGGSPISELISRMPAGVTGLMLKQALAIGELGRYAPSSRAGWRSGVGFRVIGGQDITDVCVRRSATVGLGLTPPGSRPYENPSVWGDALARVTSAAAELALAVKGQRPPPPPDASEDFSTPPPPEESFFSTPAGYVAIGGGVIAVGLIAYFALKKDKPAPAAAPAAAVKAANRRRNRRRNTGDVSWIREYLQERYATETSRGNTDGGPGWARRARLGRLLRDAQGVRGGEYVLFQGRAGQRGQSVEWWSPRRPSGLVVMDAASIEAV